MKKDPNKTSYTRDDIYNALHEVKPTPAKKIANKLGIGDIPGYILSHGKSVLHKRLQQLSNECAITHIEQKGYLLKERVPTDLTILYSECFKSIQGEGKFMGYPTVFFRTTGCNLRCWFCDTPYTSHEPEVKKIKVHEAVKMICDFNCEHVVITGGEPFIQRHPLMALCGSLKSSNKHVTIETNGSIYFDTSAALISVSPKLSGSGPTDKQCGNKWKELHEKRRINLPMLSNFMVNNSYQFKFVITKDNHKEVIAEVKTLQSKLGIQNQYIFLMPEGTLVSEIEKTQDITINACLANGWNYSDRLHVRLWGNARGV